MAELKAGWWYLQPGVVGSYPRTPNERNCRMSDGTVQKARWESGAWLQGVVDIVDDVLVDVNTIEAYWIEAGEARPPIGAFVPAP